MREIASDEVIIGQYYYFYNRNQSYFGLGRVFTGGRLYTEVIRWYGGGFKHDNPEFGVIADDYKDLMVKFSFENDIVFELTDDELGKAMIDII